MTNFRGTLTSKPNPADEHRFDKWIALLASLSIIGHLAVRLSANGSAMLGPLPMRDWPLIVALAGGGLPLVIELLWKLLHREFGSDLLAGMSIVTSIVLSEYPRQGPFRRRSVVADRQHRALLKTPTRLRDLGDCS